MPRAIAAFAIAGGGLFVSWVGHGIWRQSPDQLWAACAVVGVLSGLAVGCESRISKVLARFTRT